MDIKFAINDIKRIKLLRKLYKPWKDRQLERRYQQYLQSGRGERLRELKNICLGERCFIIGNGPSLCVDDLDRLKTEHTFAANRIFEIFDQTEWRPWAYVAVDPDFIEKEFDRFLNVVCTYRFFPYTSQTEQSSTPVQTDYQIYEIVRSFPIEGLGDDNSMFISEDITKGVSRGHTVTFTSIQLAIYMGFREIYLIGVDFNYSVVIDKNGKMHREDSVQDYFSGKKYDTTMMNYNGMLHAYQTAKKFCDEHGIKILNATRGGKLEVFERTTLEEIFGGGLLPLR